MFTWGLGGVEGFLDLGMKLSSNLELANACSGFGGLGLKGRFRDLGALQRGPLIYALVLYTLYEEGAHTTEPVKGG